MCLLNKFNSLHTFRSCAAAQDSFTPPCARESAWVDLRAAEAPPSGDARGERAKPGADILRACHTDLRPCHTDPLSLSRGSLNTKRGSPAPATRILRPCRADLRPCHADLPSLPRGFSILGWSWAHLGEVLGRSWEVLVKSWGTVRQALSLRALNALSRCRNRRGTALKSARDGAGLVLPKNLKIQVLKSSRF